LIDKAGLKGTAVGGAVVSEKHANFIVNRGGATASDVLKLIEIVRERVRNQFNTALELEVEIW
jgi:UDP-N-acetylmuramate dehydrogenase